MNGVSGSARIALFPVQRFQLTTYLAWMESEHTRMLDELREQLDQRLAAMREGIRRDLAGEARH